jgi:choline kinase
MKAIILAAGVGKRLGEISAGKPKCLLEFEQVSLLQRHINLLRKFGIRQILVVTGYRREEIDAELAGINFEDELETVFNPDYESGSVISLFSASKFLESGDDIILMDADVLYHADILQALFETEHANCLLLDRDFEAGEEPVKICVRENTIVEFRKQVDAQLEFDTQGESVGFFRFSQSVCKQILNQCQNYIDDGNKYAPYEEIIRDLLLQTPESFNYEDITSHAWIEIDFPEDLVRAKEEILKQIDV